MLVKIHNAYRMIVAVCDEDLIGKKFEEGNKQLDLTGTFFKGKEKTREEVIEIVRDAQTEDAIFNIAGKESCALLKELGVISDEGILYVDSVPVSLVLA